MYTSIVALKLSFYFLRPIDTIAFKFFKVRLVSCHQPLMYYKWQPYILILLKLTMNACLFYKCTYNDSVVYFVIVQFLLKCDTNSNGLGADRYQEQMQKGRNRYTGKRKCLFFFCQTGNSILYMEEKLLFRGRQLKWMMFCVLLIKFPCDIEKTFLIVKCPV